ncbi:MAG: hypothetical protein KDG50_03120 [Chromatiales bacterium]|nr:hypothetical protein [Chromatiales bacterium]
MLVTALHLIPALAVHAAPVGSTDDASAPLVRLAMNNASAPVRPDVKAKNDKRGVAKPLGGRPPRVGMTEEPTGPEDCGNGVPCGPGRPSGGGSGSGGGKPPRGGGKPAPTPGNCLGRQMTEEPTGCE